VYLTNIGPLPMTIKGVSLSGSSAFTQTNNCPASVPPNAGCQIQIVYAPTESGDYYSSTLSVTILGAPASTVGMDGYSN
jgi:hypothetical protein